MTTHRARTVPARSGLTRFLLTAGEEKGFAPAPGAETFTSLKGWVAFSQLTATDARLLRAEGFVAAAQESIGSDGASFVEEFRTPAGARHEAISDARQSTQGGGQVAFFSVAGLTNAHGVLIDQGGGFGTDLYWTEGRCTLWLGNGAEVTLRSQVIRAARAIRARTAGMCP